MAGIIAIIADICITTPMLLRMILLIEEFSDLCPPDIAPAVWRGEIGEIADQLESVCRRVDSTDTEKWLENARKNEV